MESFADFATDNPSNLVFIDSSLDSYQELIAGVENAEIIVLESDRDGIDQITAELANRDNIDNIHLVSHGSDARLQLGNLQLATENLDSYSQEIHSWSKALTEDGDLFLYGCNVTATATGKAFVEELAELTQADVAASEDSTGNVALGGDWDLETTVGKVEIHLPFSPDAIDDYGSLLATYNGNEYQLTSPELTWEQAQAEAEALGGNLVTVNDIIEQSWLIETFGNRETFWLGLSDRNTEGEFVWENGERVTYTNWRSGEPDDYLGREDYAVINWNSDTGQWSDAEGNSRLRGIVEIPEVPRDAPKVKLADTNYAIAENDGSIEVKILLENSSNLPVTVDYQTVDAEAISDRDYTSTSGSLTFAPGETSKSVEIDIIDDNRSESEENFSFNISNVTGANLADPRTARITVLDDDSNGEPPSIDGANLKFDNFNDISELALNGNADSFNSVLRLANTDSATVGSMFFNEPISVDGRTSFQTQFEFTISGGMGTRGSSGLTFMLQNDSDRLTALGTTGYGLGYRNIANSIAIEFDTYDSGSFDPSKNHVSLIRGGKVSSPLATVESDLDFNDGTPINAWVDYDGNNDLIEVFLANTSVKPDSPILSETIDLAAETGDRAFAGFSAASGYDPVTNYHDLRNWQFSSSANFVEPQQPSSDLLPDLSVIENTLEENRYIDRESIIGRTILRLSTEVANIGDGPLEIWGGDPQGDTQPVYQRIYKNSGEASRDRFSGNFVFYESHGHVHFESFATYNLREFNTDGSIGDVVASGGKTSFCLINLRHPYPELTESAIKADGRGESCGMIQSISVGYSDVYGSQLPGQWIDVTDVSDGDYWLEVIADPDNNIQEKDESNNIGGIAITLDKDNSQSSAESSIANI